ncbi:MAG: hypothetical protein ACI9O0_001019, partial [Paracoccaceae bacterium]
YGLQDAYEASLSFFHLRGAALKAGRFNFAAPSRVAHF